MPLADDDDGKWIYRAHTEAKHEVLNKYLTPWINKLTSYNHAAKQYNKVRIIDCFSGRGQYVGCEGTTPWELTHLNSSANIPGSPQIILDKATDRSDQFSEAECVFIEANQDNFRILDETLANTSGVASNITTRPIHGRYEETILDLVETDGSDYPTFFFIDPFGFKSLDYDVITEIGSTPQFELLITFMSRDMNRFLEVEDHQEALETVFGTPDWREALDEYSAENWMPLVEYYTELLEENGPKKTFEYLITEPDTRQTVYYLVFGTNHPNGLHTMREVMNTCGTGRFAYAPKHPEYDRGQATLFGGSESTKQFLLDRFDEYRIPFTALVEKCSEERPYQDETASDYRDALRELEDDGQISVVRITSSETGIQGNDVIDFHDD